MTTTVATATLFAALTLPEEVTDILTQVLKRYQPHVQTTVPESQRHVTLAFIDKTSLERSFEQFAANLSLPFVPTISVTHAGAGQAAGQLWAYVHPTPLVEELRAAVVARLDEMDLAVPDERPFVPHIKLANLKSKSDDVADAAAPATFPVKAVSLFASQPAQPGVRYRQIALAKITA